MRAHYDPRTILKLVSKLFGDDRPRQVIDTHNNRAEDGGSPHKSSDHQISANLFSKMRNSVLAFAGGWGLAPAFA